MTRGGPVTHCVRHHVPCSNCDRWGGNPGTACEKCRKELSTSRRRGGHTKPLAQKTMAQPRASKAHLKATDLRQTPTKEGF